MKGDGFIAIERKNGITGTATSKSKEKAVERARIDWAKKAGKVSHQRIPEGFNVISAHMLREKGPHKYIPKEGWPALEGAKEKVHAKGGVRNRSFFVTVEKDGVTGQAAGTSKQPAQIAAAKDWLKKRRDKYISDSVNSPNFRGALP